MDINKPWFSILKKIIIPQVIAQKSPKPPYRRPEKNIIKTQLCNYPGQVFWYFDKLRLLSSSMVVASNFVFN